MNFKQSYRITERSCHLLLLFQTFRRIRHLKLRPLYHLVNLEENHIPTLTGVMAELLHEHLKYIGTQGAYGIHLTSIFF
jgi:hypothetical protein